MSVCVQAVPSVSVLLLKSQLLSETGAGSVVKRWQPSEGHHPGWWQWERDFYLSCAAWVQRWEGGASRGSPPPAGINTLQCSFTQGMNHFNWDFSDYLCCDWLLSWRGAYEIRAWAFHWTPALRKKHTGPCSAAPDQCVYTIEPITTVSVFCYHYLSVSFTDCVGLKECVCVFSVPTSSEGPGQWHSCFWGFLLHTRQPRHLGPIGQLYHERALWRGGARLRHEAPGPRRMAVHPRRPVHGLRPGWTWDFTLQLQVRSSCIWKRQRSEIEHLKVILCLSFLCSPACVCRAQQLFLVKIQKLVYRGGKDDGNHRNSRVRNTCVIENLSSQTMMQ